MPSKDSKDTASARRCSRRGWQGKTFPAFTPPSSRPARSPKGHRGFISMKRPAGRETYVDRLRPKMAGGRQPSLDIDMAIGGFRLTGRVENLFPEGLLHYRLAKAKAKDRLRAWIHHLVLGMTSGKEGRGTILICEDLAVRYRPVGECERYLLSRLDGTGRDSAGRSVCFPSLRGLTLTASGKVRRPQRPSETRRTSGKAVDSAKRTTPTFTSASGRATH